MLSENTLVAIEECVVSHFQTILRICISQLASLDEQEDKHVSLNWLCCCMLEDLQEGNYPMNKGQSFVEYMESTRKYFIDQHSKMLLDGQPQANIDAIFLMHDVLEQ